MIPYFDEKKVRAVLDEWKAFELTKEVFLLIAQKKALMPPKLYLNLPSTAGDSAANDFRAMPAFVDDKKGGVCGIKWVSVFPKNHRLGRPTVCATILLNSSRTGAPLALLEGNHITAIRTAAAAAVASSYLAISKPRKLTIIGAGLQAEYQLRALANLFSFKEIGVWGFLKGESNRFCGRFLDEFPELKPYPDIKSCVYSADIIVTCTPSRRPLLKKEWVKKGAHINAIGADAKGKEELDPRLLLGSKVVVDQWQQALHSGEINVPASKGLFSKHHLYAELSQIVSGGKRGRTSPNEITIFDSTGLAVLDIYFARHAYVCLTGCQKD